MNSNLIIFIILTTFFLSITIYLQKSLLHFIQQFKGSLEENVQKIIELPKFYYDIHFKTPPKTINITNPYACTGSELKKCKLSDPTSCLGCQNLIATCTHFDQNMDYIDSDGTKHIIPANKDSKDDGYCLVIQNHEQKCNPFHGNLVLIQLKPNDTESMLYCDCINPGYIGKLDLNGACDEVFICNGNVVNLYTTLDKLECICESGFESKNTNGTPVCQLITVEKYTEYENLFLDKEHVSSSKFHNLISDNFPGNKLINPCKYCLLTGKFVDNGKMVPTEDGGWQCALKSQMPGQNDYVLGIPIRISLSGNRLLRGSKGPDAILAINWRQIFVYGYVNSKEYENSAIIFNGSDKNVEIFERLGLNINSSYAMDLIDHNVHYPGHFGSSLFKHMARPYCKCFWPTYSCYYDEGEGYELPRMLKFGNTEFKFYDGTPIPGAFLWGKEFWQSVEQSCNPVISANNKWQKNKTTKFEINPYFRQHDAIKFLFFAFDPIKSRFISVLAKNDATWSEYNSQLILKEENEWTDKPKMNLYLAILKLLLYNKS